MAYRSVDDWVTALGRFFNAAPGDDSGVNPDPATVDAAVGALYVPGTTVIHMDGTQMDYDAIRASCMQMRTITARSGAFVDISIPGATINGTSASATWRFRFQDHPPESGKPPAVRPLPPTIEVDVEATLDADASAGGRAVLVYLRSKNAASSSDEE